MKAKAKNANPAIKAAKRDFDAAHAKGMAALKRGDYEAFGDAIARERKAINSLPTMKRRKGSSGD